MEKSFVRPALVFVSLFIFLLFQSLEGLAQTHIERGEVSGLWTYDNSPYMIDGDIAIPVDRTLIIEPGVEVIFSAHYKFNVFGQILAVGTRESMISIQSQSYEVGWNGLRFLDFAGGNDTSKLVFCRIKYGKPTGETNVEKSGGGIYIQEYDRLVISDCEINTNRTTGGIYTGGGGIYIEKCSPVIRRNLIVNNRADGGVGGGILLYDNAKPILTNNILSNNAAWGGGGIAIVSTDPVLFNNTIYSNRAYNGGGLNIVWSEPTIVNTILYGNYSTNAGNEVHLYEEYGASFFNCDIEGGMESFGQDLEPGAPDYIGVYQNNIDMPPDFRSASADMRLEDSSPCIGAGIHELAVKGTWYHAPTSDFDGNPCPDPPGSPPDIGAFEHQFEYPVGLLELTNNLGSRLISVAPNPLSSNATINYKVGHSSQVRLEILDLQGKTVDILVDEHHTSGLYNWTWHPDCLPSGIYLCIMKTQEMMSVRKIIIE